MRVVGLKLLKDRLSEYVRLAASGERVLVTDRDQVVAELIAPEPGRADSGRDAALANAVRMGWLRPPLFPTGDAIRGGNVPPRAPVAPLAELLRELDVDRADR